MSDDKCRACKHRRDEHPYANACVRCPCKEWHGRCATASARDAIDAELVRARTKFPDNAKLLAALMEEVGELAQAMLQDKPHKEIRKEAFQVACVAIRLAEEGDSDFGAEPNDPLHHRGAEMSKPQQKRRYRLRKANKLKKKPRELQWDPRGGWY